MSNYDKKYEVETNNDWAKNIKEEHLFIDNAISGRRGYFCIGCDKEMEAVIRKKNRNHRSYFRHVPVDVATDDKPCTFSNRQYRETLATDILQRLKSIKVPNVYKFPPKGVEGTPMLLEKAKYITAHSVKSQITFYEDINGEIKFGKNPEIEERFLLIRPDVVFFDAKGQPILLIELVITHKVDEEKKVKLRRLGLDTVSVIVPKSSAQEIEDNFKTTKRIKWEYNGNEANTEYVQPSKGTGEGILEFDEEQRRIFQESYTCRKSRLNNTIRSIKKCIQSESYRRIEQHFESEISRIEGASRTRRERLDEMEGRIDSEVHASFRTQFDNVRREIESVIKEQEEFEKKSRDLEERYIRKRSQLEEKAARESRFRAKHVDIGEATERVKSEFTIKEEGLDLEERRIEEETNGISANIQRLENERDSFPERYAKVEDDFKQQFEKIREDILSKHSDIKSKLEKFGDLAKQKETAIESEFEELRKQSAQRVKQRDVRGGDELSKRINIVLAAWRLANNYNDALEANQRNRTYLELARKRAWEK